MHAWGPRAMHGAHMHAWNQSSCRLQLAAGTATARQEELRGVHFKQGTHFCMCDAVYCMIISHICTRSIALGSCLVLVLMCASNKFLVRWSCQLVTENKQRGRGHMTLMMDEQ